MLSLHIKDWLKHQHAFHTYGEGKALILFLLTEVQNSALCMKIKGAWYESKLFNNIIIENNQLNVKCGHS